LTALLGLTGLGLFLYKALSLGFPLRPDKETEIWTLQARFTVDATARPVKVVLQIPSDPPGFTVLDENFVSRGYGLTTVDSLDSRQAQWAIREAEGRQTLYYRVVVAAGGRRRPRGLPPAFPPVPDLEEPFRTAMQTLVTEIRAESADAASLAAALLQRLNDPSPDENVALFLARGRSRGRRAEVAVQLLAGARIPARVAYGLDLEEQRRHAVFVPWLEVHDGERWLWFDPSSGRRGLPASFFVWWRGKAPLVDVRGAVNPEVEVATWRSAVKALELARQRADLKRSRLVEFSLLSLPIQTQAVYSVMLLVPLGAFIMVLVRNVLGFKTFGTFMPVLVALAFRETRLLAGLLLFTLVMALGLGLRFLLERLRLLLAPRLAAVLILVVLILATISLLSHKLGLETGLSVALFPLVILTMAIERMSIVWEERGPGEALQEGVGTLVVAVLAYLVMSLDTVQHLVFVFPELLLVLLAATLLRGRYAGYRLLELVRFRALGSP
jgi:hypothetical protein